MFKNIKYNFYKMIHSLADYREDNSNKKPSNSKNTNKSISLRHDVKSLGKYKVPKNNNTNQTETKFHAFRGKGRAVSHVNTNGLKVNKFVVNKPDKNKPTCKIDIRLFNGVVITANFNLNQTVKDIKNFVERKSGSHNFSLLEGFPPKALTDLKKTIEELNLKGCMLTQKVK